MSGKLSDQYMDTLEQWIGTGPMTFTLLYSITRDGCNSATFHQRCDNQGSTVTVLYNQSKTIYGGYTSQSWTSGPAWINDNAAFLFKLQLNGKTDEVKFGSTSNGNDVYDHGSYGPTFGGGHDLHTFTGAINQRGGVFQLDGSMAIGNSYTNNGLQAAQINNGNMVVTELEVYKVTKGQRKKKTTVISPWRKSPSWDKKLLDDLAKDILAFKPLPELRMSAARLVMIGPVGAGKSSFYNTINSIFRGRITQRAGSGSVEQSLTTAYTPYKIRLRSGDSLNFRLCDTRGLEDAQGMDVMECSHLLDGHIPDFYEFNPATPISKKTKGFIHDPKTGDQVHCVLFILDATTLDVLSAKILQKIKEFQTIMNQKGLIQTLILTKVDKLCEESSKDISLVYKSQTVEKAVDKAANLLGIPRFNVFPVKNYENEMDLDGNTSILALLTLRQILRFTEDYMENMLDKMEDIGAYGGDSDED